MTLKWTRTPSGVYEAEESGYSFRIKKAGTQPGNRTVALQVMHDGEDRWFHHDTYTRADGAKRAAARYVAAGWALHDGVRTTPERPSEAPAEPTSDPTTLELIALGYDAASYRLDAMAAVVRGWLIAETLNPFNDSWLMSFIADRHRI
ncbi:hypothetical protein ACFQS3_02555 [Glycomyces mayteni]|uniref:Uncharacterized protein n=1 Tax=Glycomyces mayteni TaxID=543887 RepID=A0ABW2D4Z7_9ACTN|nr:hypothetical protein GCM10025732_48100 [Glycomyces mayteni]